MIQKVFIYLEGSDCSTAVYYKSFFFLSILPFPCLTPCLTAFQGFSAAEISQSFHRWLLPRYEYLIVLIYLP